MVAIVIVAICFAFVMKAMLSVSQNDPEHRIAILAQGRRSMPVNRPTLVFSNGDLRIVERPTDIGREFIFERSDVDSLGHVRWTASMTISPRMQGGFSISLGDKVSLAEQFIAVLDAFLNEKGRRVDLEEQIAARPGVGGEK